MSKLQAGDLVQIIRSSEGDPDIALFFFMRLGESVYIQKAKIPSESESEAVHLVAASHDLLCMVVAEHIWQLIPKKN